MYDLFDLLLFLTVKHMVGLPGDLYDKVAGTVGLVTLQMWDAYNNRVLTGGQTLELALLAVGGLRDGMCS